MASQRLRWNLDDIVSDEQFNQLYHTIERKIPEYQKWFEDKIHPDMSTRMFRRWVNFDQKMLENAWKIVVRSTLEIAEDNSSSKSRKRQAQSMSLMLKLMNAQRVSSHWALGQRINGIARLDNANAERLFNSIPALRYYFTANRNCKEEYFSVKEEEKIDHMKTNGIEALNDMRTMIVTNFRYPFKLRKGKGKIIASEDQMMSFMESNNPEKRERAYRSLFKEFIKNKDLFYIAYSAIVRGWNDETNWRGFNNPIELRHHEEGVNNEIINPLLETCEEEKNIFQRYWRYKSKQLGKRKLGWFDRYAPLTNAISDHIPFSRALRTVEETLSDFFPAWGSAFNELIETGHIDSHPRKNKEGGSYCMSVGVNDAPYILLNYNYTLTDLIRLAHEAGHGVHMQRSRLGVKRRRKTEQFPSGYDADIVLDETASTFTELLTFDRLLEETTDPLMKKELLNELILDIHGEVTSQASLVEFEKKAHMAIMNGSNPEELSDLFYEELKNEYGNAVNINKIGRYGWLRIPHIMDHPFYCYAYPFGKLVSLSLLEGYKKGEIQPETIDKILRYGGSEDPELILQTEVGFDIRSKEFYKRGFKIIEQYIDQLENL